jgi:septum formation protein
MKRLILASGSLGRRTLLETLKISFEVVESSVNEEKIQDPDPVKLAVKRAEAKASAVVAEMQNENLKMENDNAKSKIERINNKVFVLGGDTVGFMGDWAFGKPKSREEAEEMMRKLSGKTHSYVSAFTIIKIQDPHPSPKFRMASKITKEISKDKTLKPENPKILKSNSFIVLPFNSSISDYDISSVTFRKLSEEDIKVYLDRVEFLKLCGAFKINDSPQNFVTKVEGSISNIIGLSLEKLIPILKCLF